MSLERTQTIQTIQTPTHTTQQNKKNKKQKTKTKQKNKPKMCFQINPYAETDVRAIYDDTTQTYDKLGNDSTIQKMANEDITALNKATLKKVVENGILSRFSLRRIVIGRVQGDTPFTTFRIIEDKISTTYRECADHFKQIKKRQKKKMSMLYEYDEIGWMLDYGDRRMNDLCALINQRKMVARLSQIQGEIDDAMMDRLYTDGEYLEQCAYYKINYESLKYRYKQFGLKRGIHLKNMGHKLAIEIPTEVMAILVMESTKRLAHAQLRIDFTFEPELFATGLGKMGKKLIEERMDYLN